MSRAKLYNKLLDTHPSYKPERTDLQIVYQYFTLEQWRQIALSVLADPSISSSETQEILKKCPSVALDILP